MCGSTFSVPRAARSRGAGGVSGCWVARRPARARGRGGGGEGVVGLLVVGAPAQGAEALDLILFDCGINAERGRRRVFFDLKAVDADDDLSALFDGALISVSRFLYLALDVTDLNGAEHTAERVDLLQIIFGARFKFKGQLFDGV